MENKVINHGNNGLHEILLMSARSSLDFYKLLIQKTSEVLSLLRPIVHDTSKTAKITWFILVLHWAVDVIEVIYYIRGPVEY